MSRQQSTDVAQKFEDVDISCVFDDPISTLDPYLSITSRLNRSPTPARSGMMRCPSLIR